MELVEYHDIQILGLVDLDVYSVLLLANVVVVAGVLYENSFALSPCVDRAVLGYNH
jgi:hypothetical protein